MDIDVKNALGKALASCEAVEKRIGTPVVQAFVGDIYTFISYVSAANSDERYEYFNKVYLNGKYPSTALQTNPSGNSPFSENNGQIDGKHRQRRPLANTIISFFLVLGRYYSSSQFDRKDIDAAVTEQIKQMNDYVKEAAPAASSRKETPTTRKSCIHREMQSAYETSPDVSEQNELEESLEELLENLNSDWAEGCQARSTADN